MNPIRVMLADDHALVLEALAVFLGVHSDIEVVAQVVSGQEVLAHLPLCQPDVICMDIHMDGMDGIETTRQVLAGTAGVKVIGLSAHTDHSQVAAMLGAGASGYVLKGSASAELLNAIRAVHQGHSYLSPELGVMDVAALLGRLR